jgi:hypothetical protein
MVSDTTSMDQSTFRSKDLDLLLSELNLWLERWRSSPGLRTLCLWAGRQDDRERVRTVIEWVGSKLSGIAVYSLWFTYKRSR